jgi:hypothetical protein
MNKACRDVSVPRLRHTDTEHVQILNRAKKFYLKRTNDEY